MASTDTNPYQSAAVDEPTSAPGTSLARGLAGLCAGFPIGSIVGMFVERPNSDTPGFSLTFGLACLFGLSAFAAFTARPPHRLGMSLLIVCAIGVLGLLCARPIASFLGYEHLRSEWTLHEYNDRLSTITAVFAVIGTLAWTWFLVRHNASIVEQPEGDES